LTVQSPHLTPLDFFLWSLLKGRLCKTNAMLFTTWKETLCRKLCDLFCLVGCNIHEHGLVWLQHSWTWTGVPSCLQVEGNKFQQHL
jgi:hypothetical protein